MDLTPYFLRAVARAAVACKPWIGKGEKDAADQAAVTAMRQALQDAPMDARIVIGEGERDQAPMLHIGEELGCGGPEVDVAVDPLEGTSLCAEDRPGALCVLSYAPRGSLLHAPDIYMDKMAVGPGLTLTPEALDLPLCEVIERLSQQRGGPLRVIMLDRPRHQALMDQVRSSGATLDLIGDGDVMASLQTALAFEGQGPAYDLYLGIGGAPEGVLAASGLQHLRGQFLGRLSATTQAEQARAERLGWTDLSTIFTAEDLAAPSSKLLIAGVTSHVLNGVGEQVDVLTLSAQGAVRSSLCARTLTSLKVTHNGLSDLSEHDNTDGQGS